MVILRVQEPQGFDATGPIHGVSGSPPINTFPKAGVEKHMFPGYGYFSSHQPVPNVPQPSMSEMDGQGRLYGMPLAFPSAFRPFYIGIPGAAPLQMPDVYQHGNFQHNMYQAQQLPHVGSPVVPPPLSLPESSSQTARNSMLKPIPSNRRLLPVTSPQDGFDSYLVRPKDTQLSKRTKVSRACDECRRKKTRCDIDAEHEICTPCARSGVPCTFARAQLKRGPAKKRLSHGALSIPLASPSSQFPENISLAKLRTSTRKSRSSSDVVPKSNQPIETLLSYKSGVANGEAPNKTADSAPSSAPKTSEFPMLVEVACRQSKSPSEQEFAVKSQSL